MKARRRIEAIDRRVSAADDASCAGLREALTRPPVNTDGARCPREIDGRQGGQAKAHMTRMSTSPVCGTRNQSLSMTSTGSPLDKRQFFAPG